MRTEFLFVVVVDVIDGALGDISNRSQNLSPWSTLFHSPSPTIVVMDQGCQDIPMRLDIQHQPLNFDIYLEQVIDIPKTSIDQPPYDFHLEHEALKRVDEIIERTLSGTKLAVSDCDPHDNPLTGPDHSPLLKFTTNTPATVTQLGEQYNSQPETSRRVSHTNADTSRVPKTLAAITPPPSCPMEVPLTPIKCFIEPTTSSCPITTTESQSAIAASVRDSNCNSNQEINSGGATMNQINPLEFEEMHYNPFDHLELQTIDERKELDLVFQASYANRASKQ